jgi:integrase
MPRGASSGTKGLIKRHHCQRPPSDPTKCGCQWSGKYGKYEVVLSKWAHCKVDPSTKGPAIKVLNRFFAAVDASAFDPAGERPAAGGTETLSAFITEWRTHYAEERKLSANSLDAMLGVLSHGRLGGFTLEQIAGASEDIEKWLNVTGKTRKWKAKTWNEYHELLNRVLKRATLWKLNGKPRLLANPMRAVERKVEIEPDHFKQRHLVEDVEDRLFAACQLLNRPQHQPTRAKLTQQQADEIRNQLATGRLGKDVARSFGVSPGVVSSIKHGDIWNPEKLAVGTKGTEMDRRLIAAFDGGLRAGEMLRVQLEHVNWRPVTVCRDDGSQIEAYEIRLPPAVTKGGKTTGKMEYVYATTARFKHMLEARRFALRNNPPSRTFVFGTEAGHEEKGFRRMWRELFKLAGLDYGRDNGLVWHTTRHEFVSRLAESTKDPY